MELGNANPSELNSFPINGKHVIGVIDLNKKRKLHAEQLGLPVAKHKCWDGSLPSESLAAFYKNPEVDDFHRNIIKGIAEAEAADDGSEEESAKDSTSLSEDYDSVMSVKGGSKYEADNEKLPPYNRPSSSSSTWDSSGFKENSYSLDDTAVTGDVGKEPFAFVGEKHHPSQYVDGLHIHEKLDKPLMEFGSHVEYLYSGYDGDSIEQYMDKEIEDPLYSNEVDPNIYVLSSGRRSSNKDSQQGKRKPTIDQEFEQYFSTLML